MTPNHLIRFTQAAMLAAVMAVFVPTVAQAKPSAGITPDAFERYVAAHPYGQGVIDTSQAPDAFERYVKSHSSSSTVVRDGLTSSSGFDWSDAGIGAASGAGLLLLLGLSMLLLLRTHRRHDVQAT